MTWTPEQRKEYYKKWRQEHPTYHKEYQREHSKRYYTPDTERTDIYKSDIPLEDRCEGFDELWEMIYKQVLAYWDHIPKYKSKYSMKK